MKPTLAHQDQAQRQQALDASQSFIVQAPAGSGKTTLLIQRFLTLLNYVKSPEEILAVTFTKKAANEMRIRILGALKEGLYHPEPESASAKQTWLLAKKALKRDQQYHWDIINNPNQLRIQTIDSLCAYLTKQLPLLSHFGSSPDIADTPTLLYQEAVQEVLSHVEENLAWSNAIAKLLLHLDNDLNKLHDLLIALLAKRDQWLPYIHLDLNEEDIKKQLEYHLSLVVEDNLNCTHDLFPIQVHSELCAIACYAANNMAARQATSTILACKDLYLLPGSAAADFPTWLGIATLLLTDDHTWRKQFNISIGFPAPSHAKNPQEKRLFNEYKQRALALINELQTYEELRLRLTKLFYLPESNYKEKQWEILQALLQVLKICAAQLRITFQQYGKIDFIENTQAAITALGNDEYPTDLALALDYQIRHILVDEFQDTSLTQYQLLEKLTIGWESNDGRTLFIVGDPMQSIYRFREAEVGLFIRMREKGIGHIKLTPLTLTMNFRSTAKIVAWNNHHFQGIFPSSNDIATGAVTYNSSVSNDQISSDDNNSIISLSGFVNAMSDAQANKIVSLVNYHKIIYPTQKIAILVRARHHLQNILPALKQAQIPYRAVEIDPLAEKQTIQDLLSLTSALLHPADRIAWLAILRAPWCGLTLEDLLIIVNNNPHIAICEQLNREEILKQLGATAQKRLSTVLPILKSAMLNRNRHDTRSWIENTWMALGGPACLQTISELDDVSAFFKLLEEFGKNSASLSIKNLKTNIEKLFAIPHDDETPVQVMTIHSAKGLEFDTVILPHLERKNASDGNPLLLWMEHLLSNDKTALLLAPIHATGNDKDTIYNYIYRQRQIRANFEIDRLLYVAATRAKKHLHLLFSIHKNTKDVYQAEAGSFLKKLWPFFEKNIDNMLLHQELDPNTPLNSNKAPRYLLRIKPDWKNPVNHAPKIKIATHLKDDGFQFIDTNPKLIGMTIHRILQYISNLGIHWWQSAGHIDQCNYIKQHLMQVGSLPEKLEPSITGTLRIIQNVLNDSRGQWILQPHTEAKSEFSITAMIDDTIENLVIDRTFIDSEGIRWIIDYKTSTLGSLDLENFLAKEQE
ncbi:MAG TPA: UvrD-helicase domain-containing protein, partial [Gammaproteobacteria bacterium]|nr:UvrD-helicase domain-containing protein [Gammaproteobacteria bacterium]